MKSSEFWMTGAAVLSALLLSGGAGAAVNELRIDATAGPYADQLKPGIKLEGPPGYHIVVVTVRAADKGKPLVKDLIEAYHSKEFRAVVDKYYAGFVRPLYLR